MEHKHIRNPEIETYLTMIVHSLSGIIEHKNAEMELLQHRNHLKKLVAEQTGDLTRAKEVAEKSQSVEKSLRCQHEP